MANGSSYTLNIKALFDASNVKAGVSEIQNSLKSLKLPDKLATDLNTSFANVNKALDDFTGKVEKGIKTKGDANGITKSFETVTKELTKLDNLMIKVKSQFGEGADLNSLIRIDDKTRNELNQIEAKIKAIKSELSNTNASKLNQLQQALDKIKSSSGAHKQGQAAFELFKEGDVEKAIDGLTKIIDKLNQYKEKYKDSGKDLTGVGNSIEQLKQMRSLMLAAQSESASKIQEINNLSTEAATKLAASQSQVTNEFNKSATALHNYQQGAVQAGQGVADLTARQQQFVSEVDQVKSRIQYFFGLANSINLVKRAVRGAVDTIKELDKAMTETAVVTDYTVKDMWSQLPEYTKRANQLGVTTKEAYESATLYFQQGLNADQAAALSTETLKMARIAGLDAAEATDRMTNALRGFNMALDERSAQRVDDVYSQLAAHTASNVDEISTAMTKVASLAHNANMEFETTAAFLAQIIETTRESAETAGTALKTVVARFSEVKKLVDEGTLKGTDEEGQAIDVNKVGAALHTAGIDLNKYFLGEVGLDDIFIELASKWDSLTAIQQRYIATQAAGSRQQSRFIALMQDYARTQELVGMAYDAEGASEKQFEKTQDSLQSKLARLKNAWNEFLMGITNSGVVKGVVDALTLVLNIINKITGALGDGAGSVLKFGTAMAALGGARSFFAGGGLGARAIGGLISNGLIGNKIRASLGLGEFVTDESGNQSYQRYSREQIKGNRNTFFGTGGTLSGWKEGIQKFKDRNKKNFYQGSRTEDPSLYRALGNAFIDKGIGKKLNEKLAGSKLLGKLGLADKFTGAIAGAATLTTALFGVAVAAGAVAAAYALWYNYSPEGQLKQAAKYAEIMGKTASDVQKQAQSLKNATQNYKEYNKQVKNANTLAEKQEAIQKRNEAVTSLLENNPSLMEYVNATQEGGQLVLEINESDLEAATRKAAKGAAKAASDASFAQALVAGKQADIYEKRLRGINLASGRINSLDANGNLVNRALTPAEAAKYQRIAQQRDAARAQEKNYARQAFAEQLSTMDLEDELANTMADVLSEGFNEDEYLKQIKSKQAQLWGQGRTAFEQQYFELYGTQADASMSNKQLRQAIAQGQVNAARTGQIDALTGLLTGANGAQYNSLLQAFLGKQSFDNLLDIQSETDIYKALGISIEDVDGQLQELSQATGISTEKLREQIVEQTKFQKQGRAEKLKGSFANLYQNGISKENLSRFLNLDEASKMIASELFSSLDSSFISESFVDSLITGLETGDKDLQNWLDQLDLSDPIAAFDELSTKAEKGTDNIKAVAQSLLDAGKKSGQFSATSQVTSFLLSESYESLNEEISKFIEQNGEVDSSNILDLAESNDTLNKLLKNNVVTAKALATAVNGIESGTITVLDLNDAVLAALNSMDDLDSVVKHTIDDLNSFDAGFDENDITGFIGKALDNANQNIEKGAYGNNVMANYMRKIFGDFDTEFNAGKWGPDYGEGYKAWLKNNVTWLEANKDNMKSAWSDFASTLDNQMLGAAEIYQKDGEIILNANGMTTQQLIDAMAATGKVTKTQAEMMVADFKNYSANFAHEMAENDLPNAIQGWMDALPEINGKKIYDEADLDTLGTLFGKSAKEIEDIVNQLQKTNEKYQGIKWTNDKGERNQESILGALGQAGFDGRLKSNYTSSQERLIQGEELFDYDAIKSAYNQLGIPQLFESDFQTILGDSKAFYADFFGEQKKVQIQEGQSAGEAYAQAYQQAVNQDLADKFGDTLGDKFETALKDIFTDTEIDIDTTKAVNSLQAATNAINDLKTAAEGVQHLTVDVEGLKEFFGGGDNKEQTATQINDTIGEIHAFGAASNEAQSSANGISSSLNNAAAAGDNLASAAGEANTSLNNAAGGAQSVAGAADGMTQGFVEATTAAKNVDQAVEDIPKNETVKITVQYTEENRPTPIPSQTVTVTYTESNKPSGGATRAAGGIVKSYAKGSENFHVKPGTALTGEEGPEIVWNKEKGYSYITGSDGPEFQDLKPGDRVFNASETKKILKNSSAANGGKVGSYAEGYGDAKSPSPNNNNNKDKDKTSAEWKNELDWLYNLMEDIVELERDQKEFEEQFEDILTDDTKTSKDLYNLLIQRLGNLNVQLGRQTFALTKREQEMREFMDTTNDQDQYLWYNWSDRTIEIDWDAIDKIVDGDVYKHVKDLISEAEEIQGKMDDAEDAIADIKNQIQELENIWRDTYVDFEKRVLDAVVKSYQEVIDDYGELNDTLTKTNQEILEAIQQELDLERQIRDNTKTEDDISQKESRLAYLQRDTTGANQAEILKLQKEIEDDRENYTDTLIDQAIERISEDNDAAAKQRDKQIEIMQAQLDYQKESGEFNEYVSELISSALSPEGTLLTDSDLYQLLTKQENWAAMSAVNKQVWEEELKTTFKEVGAFLLKNYADWTGEFYSQVAESINSINKQYQINVGSYSQGQAGGSSSGSGSGGGGGGGSTNSGNNSGGHTPVTTYGKWSDYTSKGPSGHQRNRAVFKDGVYDRIEYSSVEAHNKGRKVATGSKIAYYCTVCGYAWPLEDNPNATTTTPSTPKPSTLKPSGGCFAPGTKILMGNYKVKNIEDVQINDIIMAYDEVNDEFVSKRVTESYSHHNTPQMVKLTFANNTTIELTPGHPLYSTKGWKSLDIKNSLLEHTTVATLLKIGDIIINIDGSSMLTNIEYLETENNYTSYNLEVEDCHTFLANGFVAHNAIKAVKQAYATGGLNTYTGLAMLHGSPSEPEYVLSARQTQAFLKLADVLPNVVTNNSGITNNLGGNIYLDLNMHVDEIGSDYDVDRIANRVKDILYDASSYRNVNTINFIR